MFKLTSLRCASISLYCNPLWISEINAPGGTLAPFMLDLGIVLSLKNENAVWENPDSCK